MDLYECHSFHFLFLLFHFKLQSLWLFQSFPAWPSSVLHWDMTFNQCYFYKIKSLSMKYRKHLKNQQTTTILSLPTNPESPYTDSDPVRDYLYTSNTDYEDIINSRYVISMPFKANIVPSPAIKSLRYTTEWFSISASCLLGALWACQSSNKPFIHWGITQEIPQMFKSNSQHCIDT